MATAHDDPDGQDTSPYLRVPWPLAALGILVVLGVFLGFGLWATQARRAASAAPPVSAPPEATLASTREPPFAPVTAPTAEPTPQPTVAPIAPPPPTPVPLTPTRIPAAPTQAPIAQSTPISGDPSPTVTPIPPELKAEIFNAYKRYWDMFAEALSTMDDSRLTEFMDGEHLRNVRKRMDELRSERRAIHVDVEHSYLIIAASPTDAQVNDIYRDDSFYVDLDSDAPLGEPAGDSLNETYIMTKVDGVWRVIELVRYS